MPCRRLGEEAAETTGQAPSTGDRTALTSPVVTGGDENRTFWWRPDVQGLRGVAVLLVVAYHAGGPISGGYIGVDVFFVVSGFVIGGLLARELGTGTVSLGRFYACRARRLMPALALVLVTVAAATTFLGPLGTVDRARGTARAAALVFANGYLYQYAGDGYFDDAAEANPLLHTWSLSVEEQFYLVLPVVLVVAWRWRGRRGAQIAIGALCSVSLLLSVLFTTDAVPDRIPRPEALAFYVPFTRTWEFGVGVALALAGRRTWPPVLGVVGIVVVLGSAIGFDDGSAFPGYAALGPVIGTALLDRHGWGPRSRSAAPFGAARVGRRPFLQLVPVALACAGVGSLALPESRVVARGRRRRRIAGPGRPVVSAGRGTIPRTRWRTSSCPRARARVRPRASDRVGRSPAHRFLVRRHGGRRRLRVCRVAPSRRRGWMRWAPGPVCSGIVAAVRHPRGSGRSSQGTGRADRRLHRGAPQRGRRGRGVVARIRDGVGDRIGLPVR